LLRTAKNKERWIRSPMAGVLGDHRKFPHDAGRATSTASATATPTATLPASQSGDYLVVWWRASSTLASGTSVPTGWTAAVSAASPDGSDDICGCFYKVADGSEGTSLAFPNMGTARNFAMAAWRIANAGTPTFTTLGSFGASNSVGHRNQDPALGVKNYLVLSLQGCEDARVCHSVCPPFERLISVNVSSGATGVTVFGATCRIRSNQFPPALNWFFTLDANSNNKTGMMIHFPVA